MNNMVIWITVLVANFAAGFFMGLWYSKQENKGARHEVD